jgi:hypothetical protein
VLKIGPPSSNGGSSKKIPVTASVSPACVLPGGVETLRVSTLPGSMVIYNAVYSDGGGGGQPPYGKGYGGNAGGPVAPDGSYVSSWTVSPKAPAGPARLHVFVGANGTFGRATPTFAVADLTGHC